MPQTATFRPRRFTSSSVATIGPDSANLADSELPTSIVPAGKNGALRTRRPCTSIWSDSAEAVPAAFWVPYLPL